MKILMGLLLLTGPAAAGTPGADPFLAAGAAVEAELSAADEIVEFYRVPLADLEAERPAFSKAINLGGREYACTYAFDARKDTYFGIWPAGRPELMRTWNEDLLGAGVNYESDGQKIFIRSSDAGIDLACGDGSCSVSLNPVEFIAEIHAKARKVYFDWVPYAVLRNTDPVNGYKSVVLLRLGLNGNYYHFAAYDVEMGAGWAKWFLPIKDRFYGLTMKGGDAVFISKPFVMPEKADD